MTSPTVAVPGAGGAQQMPHMHQHGGGGMMVMAHDEAMMPGLRGVDATLTESPEPAVIFRKFHPCGVRSRTCETVSAPADFHPVADAIVVTQTSGDPEIVEVPHVHAAEVSAMAARGMQAVHGLMVARQRN